MHIQPSQGHAKFIRVEGVTLNVKDALLQIQSLFTKMQKEENELQQIEHLSKEVSMTRGMVVFVNINNSSATEASICN